MLPTSIDKITIDGRIFYVKRDDLYDPHLSGNKFRKLHKLIQTPKENLDKLISYGGTQSNAMLAIAKLCHLKGWEFIYYTKPISDAQKQQNSGNFYEAVKLSMKHIEIEHDRYKEEISNLRFNLDSKTYIVDQGGAVSEAEDGLKVLADEIKEQLKGLDVKSLATPSGTGTTALFLAKALPEYKVYTTPCVGDIEYLKTQMSALVDHLPDNLIILEPKKKYHFAKLYPSFLEIYKKLLNAGIEFDLLYAPGMWEALLEQTDEEVLYIHSGGVSGNKTMLERYMKITLSSKPTRSG
ncbi:1-aminocyclopropane-1-carboxylate deaminase [Sulfurimonas sp.]|uniref:1-aminocyclopropane-1-carboxylate deaminase n=1 Tax=Sulfurimonas sp. TaxID=2022749 RepID=UPI0035675308